MLVEEVSALFLQFCDEQDTTFMTPAQRQFYLKTAYDAFRNEVMGIDAFVYQTTVNIALSDADSYPLGSGATIILGPNAAAGTRMERLLRIAVLNDGGDRLGFLTRTADIRSVQPTDDVTWRYAGYYQLTNRTLYFDRKFSATLQLMYAPESTVDWTQDQAGDNEYIDDLNQWHDIIARLAVRDYYAVRDGAGNEANERALQDRIGKMRNFLTNGWLQDGGNVIYDVYYGG
jgi:hypothetical protein